MAAAMAPRSRPLAERFMERLVKGDDCWWLNGSQEKRYGQIKDASGVPRLAHRIAYEMLVDAIPDGLWVLHRCDKPRCVRPSHLFLGTARDNTQDMIAKGRQRPPGYPSHRRVPRGEEIKQSKLSAAIVVTIRQQWADGRTMRSLGREYGVTHESIRMIVLRKHWTHI